MSTEGTENGQGTTTAEVSTAATSTTTETTTTSTEVNTNTGTENTSAQSQENTNSNEIDEESIKKFFAAKGRSVEKLDDLFVEKVKEVNPYADVNEELLQALNYSKETGRGLGDYLKLQEDIDKKPLVDVAIAKAAKEAGGNFSKEDLTEYIEDHLGIDLSGDLTPAETVKLTKYVKDYKEEFKADQEKYKAPLAKPENTEGTELITLPNGQKVDKQIYESHLKEHQAYLSDMKVAVDSVAATSLQIEFDNNGTKETLTYNYDFDENDKKNMLDLSNDVDVTVGKLFRTEKGFDHQSFAKAVWRLDPKNWEKEVTAIVNKAIAETKIESTKAENNVNFNTTSLPKNEVKEGVKIVPVNQLFNL